MLAETVTDAYSHIYQSIDAACGSPTRAVPPGTGASLSATIVRLRLLHAPERAIRDAETIALTVHRLQQALGQPGLWAEMRVRRLRFDLGRLGEAWLREAPILH